MLEKIVKINSSEELEKFRDKICNIPNCFDMFAYDETYEENKYPIFLHLEKFQKGEAPEKNVKFYYIASLL